MRLIVARCSVEYSGRLSTRLPEALRLVMLKADGSVLVHADGGHSYKPLSWMTPPTVVEDEGEPRAAGERRGGGGAVGRAGRGHPRGAPPARRPQPPAPSAAVVSLRHRE